MQKMPQCAACSALLSTNNTQTQQHDTNRWSNTTRYVLPALVGYGLGRYRLKETDLWGKTNLYAEIQKLEKQNKELLEEVEILREAKDFAYV